VAFLGLHAQSQRRHAVSGYLYLTHNPFSGARRRPSHPRLRFPEHRVARSATTAAQRRHAPVSTAPVRKRTRDAASLMDRTLTLPRPAPWDLIPLATLGATRKVPQNAPISN